MDIDLRGSIAIVANFLLIGGLTFYGFTLFGQYHATGKWAKNITGLLAGLGDVDAGLRPRHHSR